MKIFFKKLVSFLFLIPLLSSCAMHKGDMLNSASLGNTKFTYVKKDIKGTTSATYFLGFGGLSKDAIVDDAKRDLLAGNPLKDNQALVNLTISWKSTFVLPLVITKRCTITADIVEFK